MEKYKNTVFEYSGKVASYKVINVTIDDGSTQEREIVEHCDGVAIVTILTGRKSGDRIIFIKQFRIAINNYILEIPAGRVGEKEGVKECALRELEEETGYKCDAEKMIKKVEYYSSVGFTNEKMHIFLARDLVKTKQNLEFDERINVVQMGVDKVKEKLEKGEFNDSKTIIGLREYFAEKQK